MLTIDELETPALILDRRRLEANLDRMANKAHALGVDLRPHMKTAKCIEVAKLACERHSGAIAVATLDEAEFFARAGFIDLIYAVCVPQTKLDRVAAICQRCDLKILVDNVHVAEAVADHPHHHRVIIEIDCGDHRTGVDPDADTLLHIAEVLASGASLVGVLSHAGQSYACRTRAEIIEVAEVERAAAVRAAERLRRAGHQIQIVSVGSTPTATHLQSADGLTEIRPGVYTLGDLFQAAIESHAIDDIAATVLATVISHARERNTLVIDAGGLALSKDRSTRATDHDGGYGLVADLATAHPIADLRVASVSQEHGIVTSEEPLPFDRLPIGARVRVLPNHICMTAAAYDRFHVIDSNGQVEAQWTRTFGW